MQAKGNTICGSSVYAIGIEFFNPSVQKIEGPVCGNGVPHRRLLHIRRHDSNFAESGRNLSQRNDPRAVNPVIVRDENTHKGFRSCSSSCSKNLAISAAGTHKSWLAPPTTAAAIVFNRALARLEQCRGKRPKTPSIWHGRLL